MALVVLACGGFRSGSTLQYNLLGEYLERIDMGRRVGLIEDPSELPVAPTGTMQVAKCHHATPSWVDLVRAGKAVPFYSVRDHAGVVTSMARKFRLPEHEVETSSLWATNEANRDNWVRLGAHTHAYDDLVNRPVAVLEGVTTILGVPFDHRSAVAAAEGASKRALSLVAARQPQGEYDPLYLVHWDHFG